METIRIHSEKGHILIPVGNKRAVLDTGSPQSMASEPFTFLGTQHTPPTNIMGVTPQKMAVLADFPMDILIGCDLLSHCTLRLRLREGCMDIGEDIPDYPICRRLETLMGLPVFPVRLHGEQTKAIFDTGAHLSYIAPERVSGQNPTGQRDDFYPFVGRFTVNTYAVPTTLDETPLDMEYGILPDAVQTLLGVAFTMARASAVIGTQLLEFFDCTISWTRGTISWRRKDGVD